MEIDHNKKYEVTRGVEFKKMLANIFVKSKLKEKYMSILCSPESLELYDQAFTHSSHDPVHNYETFETRGDATLKHFIVWYMFKRFPKLNTPEGVQIAARLLIKWGSKEQFQRVAEKLGFWNFIIADQETRGKKMKSLLEDVFEAFCGVTEYILDQHFTRGVGFAILDNILTSIFNEEDIKISYKDIYDSKTILKEIFDKNKSLGKLDYDTKQIERVDPRSGEKYKQFTTIVIHSVEKEIHRHFFSYRNTSEEGVRNYANDFILRSVMRGHGSRSFEELKKEFEKYTYKIERTDAGFNLTIYTKEYVPLGQPGPGKPFLPAIASLKINSEQAAAQNAINELEMMGIRKEIPSIFENL